MSGDKLEQGYHPNIQLSMGNTKRYLRGSICATGIKQKINLMDEKTSDRKRFEGLSAYFGNRLYLSLHLSIL
jgi:hypothetical protein